jgi:hypothetical protein
MNLQFDQTFHKLLVGSYQRFVGQSLLPRGLNAEESARWLYADAAFAVLAHNTAPDPIFIYGNQAAQRLFEYRWDALIALPSRLSAEAPEREERERFLEHVRANGFVTGYSGDTASLSLEKTAPTALTDRGFCPGGRQSEQNFIFGVISG